MKKLFLLALFIILVTPSFVCAAWAGPDCGVPADNAATESAASENAASENNTQDNAASSNATVADTKAVPESGTGAATQDVTQDTATQAASQGEGVTASESGASDKTTVGGADSDFETSFDNYFKTLKFAAKGNVDDAAIKTAYERLVTYENTLPETYADAKKQVAATFRILRADENKTDGGNYARTLVRVHSAYARAREAAKRDDLNDSLTLLAFENVEPDAASYADITTISANVPVVKKSIDGYVGPDAKMQTRDKLSGEVDKLAKTAETVSPDAPADKIAEVKKTSQGIYMKYVTVF